MTKNDQLCFISVDVEASGSVPPTYSMLSVGACLVDNDSVTFRRLLRPISKNADPKALSVSRFSMDDLEKVGVDPRHAMREFADWVTEKAAGRTAVFVGLNAAFDWAFVNYYFVTYVGTNPFGFAPLDIKAYYAGASGADWMDARSSRMTEHLGAKKKSTHDALDDAIAQAELFRLTREKLGRQMPRS
jgi:DNA polymerase III epsilon subunit-like protein